MSSLKLPEFIPAAEQEIITKAAELGVTDEIAIRNYCIRKEFQQHKKNGLKSVQAIEELMRKYELKWSRINNIIYE